MSDRDLLSVEDMAEIPKDTAAAGSRKGGSKGVNLFLARQKLIADMMEQEEQEEGEAADPSSVATETAGSVCTDDSRTQSFQCLCALYLLFEKILAMKSLAMIGEPLCMYPSCLHYPGVS